MSEQEEGKNKNELTLQLRTGETLKQVEAKASISPMIQAADTMRYIKKNGWDIIKEPGIAELAEHLKALVDKASSGDNNDIDGILISQARTLDLLFNHMVRRASLNLSKYPDASEKYLKLALRAQANCRVTLECFANLKKPLLKQTNIAHGPQQINNRESAKVKQSAEKDNPPNELLEQKTHENWLDRGTPKETVRVDQDVEAVGEIDRAKVS